MGTVKLNEIDIGSGVFATSAWLLDGPIALISTKTDQGSETLKSRLDLQKGMFIDPLPGERSTEGVHEVIEFLVQAKLHHG